MEPGENGRFLNRTMIEKSGKGIYPWNGRPAQSSMSRCPVQGAQRGKDHAGRLERDWPRRASDSFTESFTGFLWGFKALVLVEEAAPEAPKHQSK